MDTPTAPPRSLDDGALDNWSRYLAGETDAEVVDDLLVVLRMLVDQTQAGTQAWAQLATRTTLELLARVAPVTLADGLALFEEEAP